MSIETGTSVERLLPRGNFPCLPGTSSSSGFKLRLASEVVRYVRLYFHRPPKSSCMAISKIQLRGFSARNSSRKQTQNEYPLPVALQLLAHLLTFQPVAVHLAEEITFLKQWTRLLDQFTDAKLYSYTEPILLSLSRHSTELSHILLDKILSKGAQVSVYHTRLAGQLCSIQDSEAGFRLLQLKTFLFDHLSLNNKEEFSSSTSLIFYLNAFSFSVEKLSDFLCIFISAEEVSLLVEYAICFTAPQNPLLQESSVKVLSSCARMNNRIFKYLLDMTFPRSSKYLSVSQMDLRRLKLLGIIASSSQGCASVFLSSPLSGHLVEECLSLIHEMLDSKAHETLESTSLLENILLFFSDMSHTRLMKEWIGQHIFSNCLSLCLQCQLPKHLYVVTLELLRSSCNLYQKNQKRLASRLVRHLIESQNTKVPNQHIQLLERYENDPSWEQENPIVLEQVALPLRILAKKEENYFDLSSRYVEFLLQVFEFRNLVSISFDSSIIRS